MWQGGGSSTGYKRRSPQAYDKCGFNRLWCQWVRQGGGVPHQGGGGWGPPPGGWGRPPPLAMDWVVCRVAQGGGSLVERKCSVVMILPPARNPRASFPPTISAALGPTLVNNDQTSKPTECRTQHNLRRSRDADPD